jgi:hypothetical protein
MIDVERQKESGDPEARYMDPGVVSELLAHADPDGRCLAFIDPYGDTTFNQLQLPILVDEIRKVQQRLPRGELFDRVENLILFLKLALDNTHTYVKFIGD